MGIQESQTGRWSEKSVLEGHQRPHEHQTGAISIDLPSPSQIHLPRNCRGNSRAVIIGAKMSPFDTCSNVYSTKTGPYIT